MSRLKQDQKDLIQSILQGAAEHLANRQSYQQNFQSGGQASRRSLGAATERRAARNIRRADVTPQSTGSSGGGSPFGFVGDAFDSVKSAAGEVLPTALNVIDLPRAALVSAAVEAGKQGDQWLNDLGIKDDIAKSKPPSLKEQAANYASGVLQQKYGSLPPDQLKAAHPQEWASTAAAFATDPKNIADAKVQQQQFEKAYVPSFEDFKHNIGDHISVTQAINTGRDKFKPGTAVADTNLIHNAPWGVSTATNIGLDVAVDPVARVMPAGDVERALGEAGRAGVEASSESARVATAGEIRNMFDQALEMGGRKGAKLAKEAEALDAERTAARTAAFEGRNAEGLSPSQVVGTTAADRATEGGARFAAPAAGSAGPLGDTAVDLGREEAQRIGAKLAHGGRLGALTADEAAVLGERGGYRFGNLELGGQDLRHAATVVNPLSRGRVALADVIDRLSNPEEGGILSKVRGKNLPYKLDARAGEADPQRAMRGIFGLRAARLEEGIANSKVTEFRQGFHDALKESGFADHQMPDVFDALGGDRTALATLGPDAEQRIAKLRDWYDNAREQYKAATGNDLPRREDYIHRDLTDEMRARLAAGTRGRRASLGQVVADFVKGRKLVPGNTFLGEVVPDLPEAGIIKWANTVAEGEFGHGMFKTDLAAIGEAYSRKVGNAIGQARAVDLLKSVGLARDASPEIIARGASPEVVQRAQGAVENARAGLENVTNKLEAARNAPQRAEEDAAWAQHAIDTQRQPLVDAKNADVPSGNFTPDEWANLEAEQARLGKPVDFSENMSATWRDHAAQQDAIARFNALPDDTPIVVYHGTTPDAAEALRSGRAVNGDASKSWANGLYVAPTPEDAGNYGLSIVRFVVPKGALETSPEFGLGRNTAGEAFMNSSAGAVLPANYAIDSTVDVHGLSDFRAGAVAPIDSRSSGAQWFDANTSDVRTMRRVAKQEGIQGADRMSKSDLADALNSRQGTAPAEPGVRPHPDVNALTPAEEKAQAVLHDTIDQHVNLLDSLNPEIAFDPKSAATLETSAQRSIDRLSTKIGSDTVAGTDARNAARYLDAQASYRDAVKWAQTAQNATDATEAQVATMRAQEATLEGQLHEMGTKLDQAQLDLTKAQRPVMVQRMAESTRQMARTMFIDNMPHVVDPGLIDLQSRVLELTRPASVNKFLQEYDTMLNWWKSWALATPRFGGHLILGHAWNNALAGVTLDSYKEFFAADRAFSKNGAEGAVWKRFAASNPAVADAYQQGREYVLGSAHDFGPEEIGNFNLDRRPSIIAPTQNNFLVRGARRMGGNIQHMMRTTLAMDTILKGGTLNDAIDKIATYHFDYGDLTTFERTGVRRLIPFYTWTRRNLPLQLRALGTHPSTFAKYNDIVRNISNGVPDERTVPSYYKELGAFKTGVNIQGANVYGTATALPLAELSENWLDPNTVLSQVAPPIKTPIELWAGKQFFKGLPLTNKQEPVPESLSFLTPVLKSTGLVKSGKNGDTMDMRIGYVLDSFAPQLAVVQRQGGSSKYNDRLVVDWINYLTGLNVRANTKEEQKAEKYRQYLAGTHAVTIHVPNK